MEPVVVQKRRSTFASIDVSFISLDKILPPLLSCLQRGAEKWSRSSSPSSRRGANKVGKNGVVTEEETHLEVVERMLGVALERRFLRKRPILFTH